VGDRGFFQTSLDKSGKYAYLMLMKRSCCASARMRAFGGPLRREAQREMRADSEREKKKKEKERKGRILRGRY